MAAPLETIPEETQTPTPAWAGPVAAGKRLVEHNRLVREAREATNSAPSYSPPIWGRVAAGKRLAEYTRLIREERAAETELQKLDVRKRLACLQREQQAAKAEWQKLAERNRLACLIKEKAAKEILQKTC